MRFKYLLPWIILSIACFVLAYFEFYIWAIVLFVIFPKMFMYWPAYGKTATINSPFLQPRVVSFPNKLFYIPFFDTINTLKEKKKFEFTLNISSVMYNFEVYREIDTKKIKNFEEDIISIMNIDDKISWNIRWLFKKKPSFYSLYNKSFLHDLSAKIDIPAYRIKYVKIQEKVWQSDY